MLRKVVVCAALLGSLFGCAAVRPPIQTEAALGKVVIYRNGVAYFERRALVRDGQLRLTVPVDRVDDFLKSLKVVDSKTGESLAVSFKTMEAGTDQTEMIVSVPGKEARELLVSYVTDSPAWKPSYRIVLGKKSGRAELEAWAVVDNVSGEDWKHVTVGVGSTSALSFRYDLHSVRLVERQTLGDEAAVANAPPTGGSPYAVASAETPIVAAFGGGMVDRLLGEPERKADKKQYAMASAESGVVRSASKKRSAPRPASASALTGLSGGGLREQMEAAAAMGNPRGLSGDDAALDRLAAQIRNQSGKVKLQGFARAKDQNLRESALKRANVIRDRLIARGVPADKVEATTDGSVNESQAVRVVAAASQGSPEQATRPPDESKDPIGNAYFLTGVPMTIEKDRSAMVSLLKSDTRAERVYYYDPISSRGSQDFAFQAVRIENPSNYTLDRGPFTVYAEGQFLGEGLSEAIPPRSVAFVPFALDRQLVVEPKIANRDEINRLITIDRGVVTAEVQRIRKTTFSLHNRGDAAARVYVRHAVQPGWELRPTAIAMERLSGSYLFPVTVPPRSALAVSVEESQPIRQTVDIRTTSGADSVGLYLKHTTELAPKLRAQLEEVLSLYREMADVEQRISTVGDQMNEYRKRVDELNEQLVTLRRVKTAQDLSRHLAKKMQEISDRLQTATLRSADLQEELMTRRIKVQDRLADLTLRPEGTETTETAKKAVAKK